MCHVTAFGALQPCAYKYTYYMVLALQDLAAASTSGQSFPFQKCDSCYQQKRGRNLFCSLSDFTYIWVLSLLQL